MAKLVKMFLAILVLAVVLAGCIYVFPVLSSGIADSEWTLIFEGKTINGVTDMKISTKISEMDLETLVNKSSSFKVVRKDYFDSNEYSINSYECNVVRYIKSPDLINKFECLGEVEAPESYAGLGANVLVLNFTESGSKVELPDAAGEGNTTTISIYTED